MKKRLFAIMFLVLLSIQVYAQLDRSIIPKPGPAPEIKLGEYEPFELANGLKVFVVENHKLPRVSFSLVLDIDPILEGEHAGYVLAAGELLKTRTVNRTKEQIDSEIDFIGATFSTSAASVYGASLKKHVDKLLEIMSDVVLYPKFVQEELDKIKKQTLSSLAAQKEDPDAIAQVVGNMLLFGKNHPYGEPITENTVESITLDMCNKYYDTYFRPNVAYLAIVGDITKDEAEKLIKKHFSEWKEKEVPKHEYNTPKPPLVTKVAVVDRPNAVQSVVGVGYPVELKKGSKDIIPSSVMNTILGGSFISRLNHNIREDKGWTYGAGSSLSSDQVIGNFQAGTTVRNSVTDSTVTEILREMKKLRDEKVSDDELQSTKNFITGSFARSLENPQTIANYALNIARYNLPKDYYKNYLKNLNAVNADDIQVAAKKYSLPENVWILVVGNADEVADKLGKFNIGGKINYLDTYGNEIDLSKKKIPEGTTIGKIINKYVEAIGGRDNILNVKDISIEMKGNAMDIAFRVVQKYPNKYYQLIDAGSFQQEVIFDGVRGKQIQMGMEKIISGDELESLKLDSQMNTFLDYAKYNIVPELAGTENVNGKECYKVFLNLPTGKKWIQYFSVDTGLLVRQITPITTPEGNSNSMVDYDDYREVQGVKYPFNMKQYMDSGVIDMTIISIEVNMGVDDSFFDVE